jgi:hypothetical protein
MQQVHLVHLRAPFWWVDSTQRGRAATKRKKAHGWQSGPTDERLHLQVRMRATPSRPSDKLLLLAGGLTRSHVLTARFQPQPNGPVRPSLPKTLYWCVTSIA